MTRTLLACIVAATSTPALAQPPAAKPLTGEQIAAIWQARQDRVKTVVMEWKDAKFIPKGGHDEGIKRHMLIMKTSDTPVQPPDGPFPPKDIRGTFDSHFVLDGFKVRHNFTTYFTEMNPYRMVTVDTQCAYDGVYFREVEKTGDQKPMVYVSKMEAYRDAGNVDVVPLITAFRGMSKPYSRVKPQILEATGRQATIAGELCHEYLAYKFDSGSTFHVWLSPGKDWNVIRFHYHYRDDKGSTTTIQTTDVDYKHDPAVGYYPSHWKYASTYKGKLTSNQEVTVTACRFNDPVDAAEFKPSFPTGANALVESSKVGGVTGEIMPDGNIKPTGQDFTLALPGDRKPSQSRWPRYGVILASAVILFVVAIVGRKIIRRRRATLNPAL
jgi:hypothetical protein